MPRSRALRIRYVCLRCQRRVESTAGSNDLMRLLLGRLLLKVALSASTMAQRLMKRFD
jgi:hypothetical protein